MRALAVLLLAFALPAYAGHVGTVEGPYGRIDLFDDLGVCLAPAKRAEFVDPKGRIVPGCWKISPGADLVSVVFLDGDISLVPIGAIKKPAAL